MLTEALANHAKRLLEENERTVKYLIQSKIEAKNVIRNLDALDSFTDDWREQGNLKTTALAIHLRCEEASDQGEGMINTLDGFTTAEEGTWIEGEFMALAVHHDNTQGKVDQISSLLAGVIGSISKEEVAELGVEELKGRAQAIMASLTELKTGIGGLKELSNGVVVKWRTEMLNKCILALQEVVGQVQAAAQE